MTVPMRILRLGVMVPSALANSALTVMVLALLPSVWGSLGILALAVLLVVVATGRLEKTLVRLGGAREPTQDELVALAPVLAGAAELGDCVHDGYVARARRMEEPAVVLGHQSVVVSPWLVEAMCRGELSQDEAIAVIAHAVGRYAARPQRCEMALRLWTAPMRVLSGLARRAGATSALFAPARASWQVRGVVGIVCVVQSAADGRTILGMFGAGFVALTYLVPVAQRSIDRREVAAADEFVRNHDLGPAYERALVRSPWGAPVHGLQQPVVDVVGGAGGVRPGLSLVRP